MQYRNKDIPKLRGVFPSNSRGVDKKRVETNVPTVFNAAEQFYAIENSGEIIKRFELILACGKRLSFSYSMLPVCIKEDSSKLYIRAYELLITITGRNLDPIHEHFTSEVLIWVKASSSGKDSGKASTFVQEIKVEGETVSETI